MARDARAKSRMVFIAGVVHALVRKRKQAKLRKEVAEHQTLNVRSEHLLEGSLLLEDVDFADQLFER